MSVSPMLFTLAALAATARLAECLTRNFYVAIREEEWDYAPKGTSAEQHESASVFLTQGPHRIGHVYRKAVYRQYSDYTYTQELPKPSWLGFLGPVLKAEVHDVLVVHLKNLASRPYSLHPHGVFYDKDSEGALYPDGTTGKRKRDDAVLPGGNHTYTWTVKDEYAPTEADPNCLTWVYHSHIDAPRDISSGLVGALLTCKKGVLQGEDRTDVDRDFVLMFSVVDENLSWYLEENIETFCSDPSSVNKDNEDFQESNKMHAINGFVFENLLGLDMCTNKVVSWHLFGMGSEVDIHSAYFFGHTVLNQGHRADVVSLFPAAFVTVEMFPRNPGKWLLSCQVNDHIQAGMQALYQVFTCDLNTTVAPPGGRILHYYIAAETVMWDYGPQGRNAFDGQLLNATGSNSEPYFSQASGRIGGRYLKVMYVEYSDNTFTKKKPRTENEFHLGILGPVIKGEVGDTILVMFKNKADRNYSIQAHGLSYSKESEGSFYADGVKKPGCQVQPNDVFTYRWVLLDGPTTSDPDCLTYIYYSSVDPVRDTNSGLVGPLLVCRKNENGHQSNIDDHFFLLFTVFDENLSWYLSSSIAVTNDPSGFEVDSEEFHESNKMHAVNGYMFGNMPTPVMCAGSNISWHLLALGTEVDLHSVRFQGNTIQKQGSTRDTVSLFPHISDSVLMQVNVVGDFEISCSTADHYSGGMRQLYSVRACKEQRPPVKPVGVVRTYYIAAEEVEWDYAPNRSWELARHNTTGEQSYGHTFIDKGHGRIGSKYKKVVYREYSNGHFTKRKSLSPEEEHLQILGPLIKAEVGDIILIVFKNMATRPYSIEAHGVQQEIVNHGLRNTAPGQVQTYRWNVPEGMGPSPSDSNCLTWAYHSGTNFVKDTYSGLVGPLITCRRGVLDVHGRRKDVDREFALLFMVFDENQSWYLGDNIAQYLHTDLQTIENNEDFLESNQMHAINGKLFGNLHGLVMTQGEKTDWYLLGMGSEVDLHTVHFHAQTFIFKTDQEHRADVYDLFPGTFQTIELMAGNPGTWLLHCHVNDHIHAGMETVFTVLNRGGDVPFSSEDSHLQDAVQEMTVDFFGKQLDKQQAKDALISLFTVGLLLLIGLCVVLGWIAILQRRKGRYPQHGLMALNDSL
ncbi:hephaestin-like protein 1a isoform X1 [Erpetoichthys calabaricus]|uniref:hephaestin-like protein 1a isoform X1 n=1 Tax=Erpetoichthys calabaricus TaxID=27687 RepID=UPI00109EECD3|nr:hephaestin-like protein 1a isoform X1 [Erpetoichthys calabaricus]